MSTAAANGNNKIMVAMSGGVDSAACAILLKNAGYDVHCAVFLFSDAGQSSVAAAKEVCDHLSLPLDVVDVRDRFDEIVALPFCQDYCSGFTPSPCVVCNPNVKFWALCKAADERGCQKIATGHYARVENFDGNFVIRKSACLERDQSYMLYGLTQEQLSRLVLPLGEREKHENRALAAEYGLKAAAAPDSQEICFIPDGNYTGYIHERGLCGKQGNFISPSGEMLGQHLGVEHYTVGQRKGLGGGFDRPVFVRAIEDNGNVQLCYAKGEYFDGAELKSFVLNPHFSAEHDIFDSPGLSGLTVKVRSAASPAGCSLVLSGDVGEADCKAATAKIIFDAPVRAVAPGQAAVVYKGEYVVGGGIISKAY